MANNNVLKQSLIDIKKVVDNTSWFRDTPHYWATASLPLAYAAACVEVVSKVSVKAGEIYQQIIEAWGNPGLKDIYEAIKSEASNSELEKIEQAYLHPETEFSPDPNKPFRELERMFTDLEIDNDFFKDDDNEALSPEDLKDAEELAEFVCLILKFVITGFNKESEITKRRYRVLPSVKYPWLILAVLLRTLLESHNITLERLRNFYKVRRYKGKIIDFHKILTEQPMSRWHSRMIASGKAHKLKLKNDRIFVNAARAWYQCRVMYPSINKYLDAEAFKGNMLDLKNLQKQIRPCDDAVGYIRRLPRKVK